MLFGMFKLLAIYHRAIHPKMGKHRFLLPILILFDCVMSNTFHSKRTGKTESYSGNSNISLPNSRRQWNISVQISSFIICSVSLETQFIGGFSRFYVIIKSELNYATLLNFLKTWKIVKYKFNK